MNSVKSKKHIVFDTEIFANKFLFCGRVLENRNLISIWGHERGGVEQIEEVLNSGCTFISFNGIRFDIPVISAFLSGKTQEEVKMIANLIIENNMSPWEVSRKFNIRLIDIDHIDLMEVAPSFVSLKAYGARMHMPWLKDLPYPHDATLTAEEAEQVLLYCVNDLDTTEELYNRLKGAIDIRVAMGKEYGIDMRSKSDTQMAEAAFMKRLKLKRTNNRVPPTVRYTAPHFVHFESDELRSLLAKIENTEFLMNQSSGHVILPDFLGKDKVKIGHGIYQLGVGGIHSTHDRKVCHVAGGDYIITDIDAASYYPSIILRCGLIPQGGEKFIEVYSEIYKRRLEAKKSGDKVTDATLKISLNGTFGKLMEKWSPLYAPELGLAVTLTGQLTLLSMIEQITLLGADVLSANTDGIAVGASLEVTEKVKSFVKSYSEESGFDFEYTPYRVLAIKDVNNYQAVKMDRKIKAKGIYAPLDLRKNPTAPVCAKAVGEWISSGKPIMETLRESSFLDFISARGVTGGGVQGDTYLGKVVRWYYTDDRNFPPITYASNGNKVPKTEGARACMTIDKNAPLPLDLDYNRYYFEALCIARDIGCSDYLTEVERNLIAPKPKSRKRK